MTVLVFLYGLVGALIGTLLTIIRLSYLARSESEVMSEGIWVLFCGVWGASLFSFLKSGTPFKLTRKDAIVAALLTFCGSFLVCNYM